MSSPTTIEESHAPSYRRSFHYDRTPSPEPSLAGSRSEQPLSDGIALLPWNRVENFGALGPPRKQSGGSTRKWRQYLPAAPRLKSLLVVFLRSLRLIFFTAIGPWRTLQEQPKVAIYQQWLPAILALSVHIIPLVAAVSMLLLNLKTTIVEHSISNTSLQYLAKALELLTQSSISAAAFTCFRIVYTSDNGVPFGAITAGLQLSSLSYLWSLDLLGSLLSTSFQLRRKAVFAVFVLMSILLTATVGPAIATCLIPRVQDITISQNEAYFPESEDTLFPAQIDADYVSDTCKSLNQSSARDSICPFTGWGDLGMTAIGGTITPGANTPGVNLQLSYGVRRLDDSSYRFSVALASTVSLKPESSIMKNPSGRWRWALYDYSFLTAPSLRTLKRLDEELWDSIYATKVSWQEPSPVAVAFCDSVDFSIGNQTALQYTNPFDPESYGHIGIDLSSSNGSQDTDYYYKIHWSESTTLGTSVVAMVLCNNTVVQICPIVAGWVNSTQSLTIGQWPDTNDLTWSRDPVNISAAWAALLTPEFVDSRTSVIDSLLPRESNYILGLYAEQILAGLVVNGMSSYAYNPTRFDNFPWRNQTLSTKYHNTYSIYFHTPAYSTKDLAVQLSLAVLATYVAYILAFIIYTLGFSRTASFAWDSISELVALALLSKPPEKSLRNTRAGIETVELLKQHVHIRVVEDEKLELVFKDEDSGRPTSGIEPNRKY